MYNYLLLMFKYNTRKSYVLDYCNLLITCLCMCKQGGAGLDNVH